MGDNENILDALMETICKYCHWPHVDPDDGTGVCQHCDDCPVELAVKKALAKSEGEGARKVATVVAETFRDALVGA